MDRKGDKTGIEKKIDGTARVEELLRERNELFYWFVSMIRARKYVGEKWGIKKSWFEVLMAMSVLSRPCSVVEVGALLFIRQPAAHNCMHELLLGMFVTLEKKSSYNPHPLRKGKVGFSGQNSALYSITIKGHDVLGKMKEFSLDRAADSFDPKKYYKACMTRYPETFVDAADGQE